MRRIDGALTKSFKLGDPNAVYRDTPGREVLDTPTGVSIIEVYRALKAAFGAPNGPFDEFKSRWCYVLEGPESTIDIHDWKFYYWRIIINPHSSSESEGRRMASRDGDLFLSSLRSETRKFKISRKDYSHLLIANGYRALRSNGDYFMRYYRRMAKRIDSYEKQLMREFRNGDKMFRPGWTRRFEGRVKREFGFAGTAILWAAAVSYVLSTEAVLSLVYELYMREEIASSAELVERVSLYSMKEKWMMAYVMCDCFKNDLQRGTNGYESLQRLSVLRNNLAHANISKELRTYFFLEDGIEFPLRPEMKVYDQMPTPYSVDLEDVERIRKDVETLIKELLQNMKRNVRWKFSKLMAGNSILLSKTGRPIRNPWFL